MAPIRTEADGLLNPDLYHSARLKIVWLLDGPRGEGGWEMLREPGVYARIGHSLAWQVMAYVTYSLLAGCPAWEDMRPLHDAPEMAECLRAIGCFSARNTAGRTMDAGAKADGGRRQQDTLKARILETKPEILIGCAPDMETVTCWYDPEAVPRRLGETRHLAVPGGPLLLEVAHPSQRQRTPAAYVDEIVSVVRENGTILAAGDAPRADTKYSNPYPTVILQNSKRGQA